MSQGKETRIPMAIDGHFWVDAKLNGHDVKFLVDSGATMTTIDRQTAKAAGIDGFADGATSSCAPATASSGSRAAARTSSTSAGSTVSDVGVQIADNDDLNVLGMNYLSSLSRWGVEGRWLVLVP